MATMDKNDLFLEASRRKLRFSSVRGELTTEQLWELPLIHRSSFDLNTIARGINAELREASEDSFVSTKEDPQKQTLEIALDVVRCIIAVKQADIARKEALAQKAQERRQILEALSKKDADVLQAATREELLARLAALDEA